MPVMGCRSLAEGTLFNAFALSPSARRRGGNVGYMAGRRAWIMRVSFVTLCYAVASAGLTVDPDAELPHVEGPAEIQVHR